MTVSPTSVTLAETSAPVLTRLTALVPFSTCTSSVNDREMVIEPPDENVCVSVPPAPTNTFEKLCGPFTVSVQLLTTISAPS